MKAFLLDCFKFAVFLPPCYLIVLILWGEVTPGFLQNNLNYRLGAYGHMHSRIAEARREPRARVLVMGSSHAYRGFDPRIFEEAGLTMFNLGSSAQTPLQTEILLNRYLERINPELVVLEVYPVTFTIDGIESALDLIANDPETDSLWEMAATLNNIAVWHNLIYGHYRRFFRRDQHFIEDPFKAFDTYIQGGYVEKNLNYRRNVRLPDSEKLQFLDYQKEAFLRIVHILRASGVPFVFVQAPITIRKGQTLENMNDFNDWVSSLGPHLNFNGLLDLDDELHFYDPQHLNQNGVRIFNQALIPEIERFLLQNGPNTQLDKM